MTIARFFVRWVSGAGALVLAGSAVAADTPAVIQMLEQRGLSHVQEFQPGEGLRGFAGMAGQQPVTVYVMPDGNAIMGDRIDAQGQSLDAQRVDDLVAKPMSAAIWKQLGDATWVRDGKTDAPRIVYTFSDPNCPYCNRFWEAARPWVQAGKVQLRHVIVGVIRADSSTKAAAILGAPDSGVALEENERNFKQGGIQPAASVPDDIRKQLDANQALMAELGFRGTPGIVYQDDKGLVQRVNGLPQGDALQTVLGPD